MSVDPRDVRIQLRTYRNESPGLRRRGTNMMYSTVYFKREDMIQVPVL